MSKKSEHKFVENRLHFDLTLLPQTKDADGRVWFEGYANTVTKDRVKDSVLPAAFVKTLPTYMKNPQLLYQHNWDISVGSITEAVPDEKGLRVKGFVSAAPDCESYRIKVLEKVLRTLSIGYNEVDSDMDEASDTKIVKEVELLEISLVTIPANIEAMIQPTSESQPAAGDGKGVTVILSGNVTRLIKDEKALPAVAAFLTTIKGDHMTTQDTAAPAAPKAEPKPAEPAAAPGAAPASADKPGDELMKAMDAMKKAMDEMHATCKAMHEDIKSMKTAPKSDEPKGLTDLTDAEVEAALVAEQAELDRLRAAN